MPLGRVADASVVEHPHLAVEKGDLLLAELRLLLQVGEVALGELDVAGVNLHRLARALEVFLHGVERGVDAAYLRLKPLEAVAARHDVHAVVQPAHVLREALYLGVVALQVGAHLLVAECVVERLLLVLGRLELLLQLADVGDGRVLKRDAELPCLLYHVVEAEPAFEHAVEVERLELLRPLDVGVSDDWADVHGVVGELLEVPQLGLEREHRRLAAHEGVGELTSHLHLAHEEVGALAARELVPRLVNLGERARETVEALVCLLGLERQVVRRVRDLLDGPEAAVPVRNPREGATELLHGLVHELRLRLEALHAVARELDARVDVLEVRRVELHGPRGLPDAALQLGSALGRRL